MQPVSIFALAVALGCGCDDVRLCASQKKALTPAVSFVMHGAVSTELGTTRGFLTVCMSRTEIFMPLRSPRVIGYADEGLVRIGCACYTTEEEIERLLAGL